MTEKRKIRWRVKMKTLVNNLRNLPVAVSGLALGTAGLGNVLASELHYSLRYICATIALAFLLMVAIKKIAHPKQLINEITHPVAGSFIPAFDMALMVIADIIAHHSLIIGQIIWYSAICLHLVFAVYFIYYRIRDFDLNHMLPSWFVPPVGIIVACVTSGQMHAPFLTHIIFYVGFTCYCILLPIMIYRLIFGDRIVDAQLPAFGIMGAPASLCLAGYLSVFKDPNPTIIGMLLALALMMTALVYISLYRINPKRISFIPIYASFTFPMAIGSTALIKYANYVGINTVSGQFWHLLGLVELSGATVIISWVLVKMTQHVLGSVILPKFAN